MNPAPGTPEGNRKSYLDERNQDPNQDNDKYAHLFQSCEDYLKGPGDADLKWVIEGLIPEGYLAVLAGTSKSGKSCLATALAHSVALGLPFLGRTTAGEAVLWVAYEECREERAIALKPYERKPPNLYITHDKVHIDTPEGLGALRWWIRHVNAKLIVIDPLYAASVADSLSDGRTARDTVSGLKELCRTERCAALVLHHLTKNTSAGMTRERFADSNQIIAAASMDILLDFRQRSDDTREITLHSRGRGDFANRVWLIASNGVEDYRLLNHGTEGQLGGRQRDDGILAHLREASVPMSAAELTHATGFHPKTVRNHLSELSRTGAIAVAGKEGRALRYRVPREAGIG